VRWGIAEKTLNDYINIEKVRRPFLATAKFTAGEMSTFLFHNQKLHLPTVCINKTPGIKLAIKTTSIPVWFTRRVPVVF